MAPFTQNTQYRQIHGNGKQLWLPGAGGGGGVGGIGSDCLMGMGFSFGVMKIFWNQIAVTVTQHCERT